MAYCKSNEFGCVLCTAIESAADHWRRGKGGTLSER